jgi:hypothetical protein
MVALSEHRERQRWKERSAFGKENKHDLVHSHHHLHAVPVAESMQGGFFLRKEPLEYQHIAGQLAVDCAS